MSFKKLAQAVFLCIRKNGDKISGTWHYNYEDAKRQAEYEFGEPIKKWMEIPENVNKIIDYILTQPSA